ncbi:hypothetical protein ABE099_14370 [Paenibacillus turicensis]|uniref:hypothetical protein n=1 Tax=Paenibacillus turicensis TaxID=160487 RepID=UPI003D2AE114
MRDLIIDHLHIDAIVDLLKAAFRMEDWDKMIIIADKLYSNAVKLQQEKSSISPQPKRHLVYYFGFSQLAKGVALQNKKQYSESKMLIEKYSDLSLLDDGSPEAKEEIDFFRSFANLNRLAVNVLEGNKQYIETYVQFLKEADLDDKLAGILNIIEASLTHNFNIDDILTSFENEINTAISFLKDKNSSYVMKLFYSLALYNIKHRKYSSAINNILQGLESSKLFKDSTFFRKFVSLYKSFSHCADDTQQEQFMIIMKETLKSELVNEKNIFFNSDFYFELVFD